MASPTQRWILLLSMCLLLQQFAPAYTAHVKKKTAKQNKNTQTKEVDTGGEKRFISALKFIGSKALKGITFGSYAVAFGSTVLQAIAGCKVTYPSIETDFEKFQELQDEYVKIKEEIRDVSRLATERQIYSNDTFYNYRDTRDLVRALADEQTLVLRSMGPEVLIVLNNVSSDMERIFEERNKTDQAVDLLEVDTEFAEGLELGLRLTMTSAALAMPGLKLLWNKYLKNSVVGQKITLFVDKFKSKVAAPASSAAKASVNKILSKGILGRLKTTITTKLNKIISKVAPKFAKAKNLFSLAKSSLTGLVKLGTAALAVWTAVETFNNCKAKSAEAKKSVTDMTEYVEQIKQHLAEVKEANENVQQAWVDVHNTSLADDLIESLKDMKAMMLEEYFSKPKEEKDNVAEKIQEYIDTKDLSVDDEETKKTLNDRQRAMNEVLGTITVTLSCFRSKGNAFGTVKLECARGDSPYTYIYNDIVNKVPVDPAKKCQYRTGEEYITEEKMAEAWQNWAETNEKEEVCLMNNNIMVGQVKDNLREKITDASVIAGKLLRQDKIENGGLEEIEAMITKIKEENPDIENEVTDAQKKQICDLKKQLPPETVMTTLQIVLPTLTVDQINSVQCD